MGAHHVLVERPLHIRLKSRSAQQALDVWAIVAGMALPRCSQRGSRGAPGESVGGHGGRPAGYVAVEAVDIRVVFEEEGEHLGVVLARSDLQSVGCLVS